MAYEKTNWTNTTPINPTNLNKIEEGISQNSKDIETNNTNNTNLDAKIGDLKNLKTTDKSSLTGAINEVIDKLENYFTNEQIIGTWLGKPLYRKVIEVGSLPNNTLKEVAHNISNLDFVVNLKGAATNGNNCLSLPRIHTTITLNIVLEISKTNVVLYDQYDFSEYTGYVIVEYTKTTD